MKIKQVLSALEQFAPLPLQESWDNAGLQLGLTEAEVSGALLCLDVNEEIVDEAIRKGCNLIVSHHPLLFRGLKQICGQDYVQRCVIKAIKNDIVIVSMHTNMDNARDGVNWKMAERLGLVNSQFFAQKVVDGIEAGSGVVGELPEAMAAQGFVELVKRQFDVQYHQYFGYEQQIQICVIGHYQSEQYTSEIFRDIIQRECPGVRTEIAETSTNPIYYY